MFKVLIRLLIFSFTVIAGGSFAATNIAILVDGKSQYYDDIIELY